MDLIITLFDILLVDPMTNVLVGLARLFGGSFGLAIIVFTLIMRGITWPLTAKQYKQSRAMQQIQPKVQELQKKYKGKDPKKMQQEMMALYREAGVNPLGCLLPMLVQFPIWIALYQVIRLSLGETPESFVTLSQRLYPIDYLQTAVPLDNHLGIWNLGQNDPTFILPVIVAVTMYVQQKMITPRPVTSGPMTQQQLQQQQTQQMMTWMLPLMFGWISTTVPAGLALYWAVSNAAGIVMQYFYAGRRLDWRNLLSFGPPAQAEPAKQIKGEDRGAAAAKTRKDEDSAPSDGATEETSEEPVARDRSETRRKRHGRRRGKR